MAGFRWDGSAVAPLPGFSDTPFPTLYGATVAAGDVASSGADDLASAAGPDPAAGTSVTLHTYVSDILQESSVTFAAFPGGTHGAHVAISALGL